MKKAFHTKLDSIIYDSEKEPEKFVIHAEMHIHGQKVMLSDWGGNKKFISRFSNANCCHF